MARQPALRGANDLAYQGEGGIEPGWLTLAGWRPVDGGATRLDTVQVLTAALPVGLWLKIPELTVTGTGNVTPPTYWEGKSTMDARRTQELSGSGKAMSGRGGPRATGWPEPQEVRRYAEAALAQVMAAGEVARAIWKLLVAGPGQTGEPEQTARRVIDSSRRRHALSLDVYHLAAYAAGLATTGSSDLAALALIELAELHRHLGYPQDALWLLHAADTDHISEPVRRALATVRAVTTQQAGGGRGHG